MIDLHCHILPGLDDGVRSLEEARELAEAAAREGVDVIAATPHVRDDYPTSAGEMRAGVAAVRAELRAHAVPVDVVPGGEVALDFVGRLSSDDLGALTLGGSGRYVLVEFPYLGWPLNIEHEVWRLRQDGLTAVLAHPERNADVQASPARLESAVRGGALVQVTAASLDGRLGRRTRRAAKALLEEGLVHLLASDAHSPAMRGPSLRAAAAAVRDPGLAAYLTREAPAAIVAGEALPQRPRG